METIYRQEIKYRISYAEKELLLHRMRAVLKTDTHANESGKYLVRTLYFDDVYDTAMMQGIIGAPERMKYRIRMYNADTSFIRLEKKIKRYAGSRKIGAWISEEDCLKLMRGEYDCLLQSDSAFLNASYLDFSSHLLMPKSVVQYTRYAFVCPQDDVRITLDEDVCTCNVPEIFFAQHPSFGTSVFENRQCVLEVKYTHFLSDYVPALIGVLDRSRIATSKYIAGRVLY